RRVRQPNRVAAILRRRGEQLAVDDEGDLLAVGRERELADLVGERPMLDRRRGRRAAEHDWNLARLTGRRVDRPDAKVTLERNGLAVGGDRRPQDTPLRKLRDRSRTLHRCTLHLCTDDVLST